MAETKTFFTHKHSLNGLSKPRPGRTLVLGKPSEVLSKFYLTRTTKEGNKINCLVQAGFAAFGKGVRLISVSPYGESKQLSR